MSINEDINVLFGTSRGWKSFNELINVGHVFRV